MNEYTFTWLIDHFSPNDLLTEPKQVRSPVFNAENLTESNSSWYLILTLKPGGDSFACSLVRNDAEEEDIQIIKIDFYIEITVEDKKLDVRANRKKEAFKKGDSNLWDSFKFGSSPAKLMLRCNMLDCSLRENPTSLGVTILSKLGYLPWSPSCISDKKYFPGAENTEFEVCFKLVDDKVSLSISRIDNAKTLSCFFMCKVIAHDEANWKCISEINHMQSPLNYNQTFDLPLNLERNRIINSGGIYVINIYFNCSVLVGMIRTMSQEKRNCDMKKDSMASTNAVETLRNDLERTYTEKIRTDLELKVGNKVFPVHKFILLARSPVFQKMFDQDMVENKTGVVDITDVDAKILDMFLKYMYTGSCGQLDWESALNLMLVAEKYQVFSLKKDCSDYLITALSEGNVCEILNAADMVSDNNLKGCAMDYMKSHRKEILLSDNWETLLMSNSRLVAETLRMLSADINTIDESTVPSNASEQLSLSDEESTTGYSGFSSYLTSASITKAEYMPDRFFV